MRTRGSRTGTEDVEASPIVAVEGSTPIEPDMSGWTPHPSERRDFWNRIRAFPPEVVAWRRRMIKELAENPRRFTLTTGLDPGILPERLDAGISHLREVARILAILYGSPNLGNKTDPTDELVYIILARKTRESAYQQTFNALKKRFRTWDRLLDAPRAEVERLVFSGGLSEKKVTSLYGALGKIRETFGTCTLEPARNWPDDKLESFLCELPEIQRKSAYCVMMYAFGRKVFPADTHVGRALARIGPYRDLGLSLDGLDHKKLQGELAELIPPNLRYSLHVNLVEHGRAVCRSSRPLCERCELRNLCQYYRRAESNRAMATDAPSVIDLFAGAGGSSEGFARPGSRLSVQSRSTRWLPAPFASITQQFLTKG
jgi:endonuclease III